MKTLKYFILEKSVNKQISLMSDSIVIKRQLQEWYNEFKEEFHLNGPNISLKQLRKSLHPKVYIRSYFGIDNVETNIKEFLNFIIQKTNTNFSIEQLHFNYGFYREASGQYNSVCITNNTGDTIELPEIYFKIEKNDYLYIVNTVSGKQNIIKKTLTPDNLGLNSFKLRNKIQTINTIETAINTKLTTVSEEFKHILISLCKSIEGTDKIKFDDLIGKTVNYKFDSKLIKELNSLDETDKNNIRNDFGEILGPLMFMDVLDSDSEIEISYPNTSNAKKYDYTINDTINISAKSGGGSSASVRDAMLDVRTLCEKNIIDINKTSGDEQVFLKYIVPLLGANSMECKQYKSITRLSIWEFIKIINLLNNTENIKNAFNVLERNSIIPPYSNALFNTNSYTDYNESLDALYNANKLEDFLRDVYNALGYKPSSLNTPKKINDTYSSISKEKKEDIILYPFKVAIVNYLNTYYSEYISKYISMVYDGFQLDFNFDKNNTGIIFKLYSLQKHNYILSPGGSVNNAKLKGICTKIKK